MNDNKRYTDALIEFHKERLSSLSNPTMKCEGCQNPRQFVSHQDKLIFTCGSQGSGKCGVQYEITVPHYTYFPQEYNVLSQCIYGHGYSDDIDDVSRYAVETAIQTFEFSKPFQELVKEASEYRKHCDAEREKLVQQYQKLNKEESRIQQVHDVSRIRNTNATKRLKLQKMMKETDDPMQLSQLRKEYVDLFVNEREELYPKIDELTNDVSDDYVVIKQATIDVSNDTYKKTEKKKRKPRKKPPQVTTGS
tara:strand:+ start:1449 stop:2198 length:750 start_codon:yes stop_codon:yes gene_type:complete